MKKISRLIFGIIIINISFSAINVVTTLVPLKGFVEKIAGELVQVSSLIPKGANVHSYEPTPRQLQKVANAKLLVKLGADFQFEKIWLPKLLNLNPQLIVCDSSDGIDLIKASNSHDDHHHHSGADPHIWLSPENAIKMVQSITDALIKMDTEHKHEYLENSNGFINQILEMHQDLLRWRQTSTSNSFLVFHPAWSYFAHAYDLEQHAIETDGKEPRPRQLMSIIKEARSEKIKTIFIEPQYSKKAALTIAREIDATVVQIDPLAVDYIKNMKEVAIAIFEK